MASSSRSNTGTVASPTGTERYVIYYCMSHWLFLLSLVVPALSPTSAITINTVGVDNATATTTTTTVSTITTIPSP